MTRDISSAIRSNVSQPPAVLNSKLEEQLLQAGGRAAELDLEALLTAVSAHYDRVDTERRGVVRSMQLMSDEAQALTREIRAETASHLQAILDNVKDAIVTVDGAGHIETCNPTGERMFGYSAAEILGRALDFLLPDLAPLGGFAAANCPVLFWGKSKTGRRVAVEITVSKATLNRREGYIVCMRDSTERQQAEQSLRESEARYRTLVEHAPEVILVLDVDQNRFVDVNDKACRYFNKNRASLLASGLEVISPALQPDGSDSFARQRAYIASALGGAAPVFEWLYCDASGGGLPCEVRFVRLPDSNRRLIRASVIDITARKQAETAVFQAKERAQVTLQSIGDAVITTDSEGRIDYMNPVAESLTGWETREAEGRLIGDVMTVVDEVTLAACENPVMRCLREGRGFRLAEHAVLVNRRGQQFAIQDSAAPIRDRAGTVTGTVMVFHDVSKERRLHRALHHQASHDALTGLINRREFENRLTASVDDVLRDAGARHALLYLDLDQFKVVNDTCGHQAGDLLLKQITGVLQSRVRDGDTLARLGGDEFGILLQACPLEQALRVAEGLRQAIRDFRFTWQEAVLTVGVSIGIAGITRETPTVATVMSAADVACYTAKDQGRDRVQLYRPDNVPERVREMHWVTKLTRAFDESRFEMVFQPIVPIGANRDAREHFELMLRLREDSGALISPNEFISAAERYNVMPAIDRWVVRQALDQFVHRTGSGIEPYTIAVNLSGTSLNDARFLEFLLNELTALHLAPGAICFEITETAAIANLGHVVHFMRELKTRGCHFALDDFGSGLSSFMYLKTLPVDYLKIDGRFIENIAHDPVDRSMVEAISQVGAAMGIKTIAERVESLDVLNELARLGIGFAQGYFIAEPLTTGAFPYPRERRPAS